MTGKTKRTVRCGSKRSKVAANHSTKLAKQTKPIAGKGKQHTVASKSKKRTVASKSKKRTVARKGSKHIVARRKPRYAYPASGFFMWAEPANDLVPYSENLGDSISHAFSLGTGAKYSPNDLLKAGVFEHIPLRGGIFNRREPVRNIIIHSTETESPADGPRVIKSWNHGMRHPGAQYVVDRNGKIYQTVDPDYGTVHVDIFRTHNGINNDNSIGIEIVRAGKQKYTSKQLDSVVKLVAYLQHRYSVDDTHVFGHGEIQPSNRTDPVGFDWGRFQAAKESLQYRAKKRSAPVPVASQVMETAWTNFPMTWVLRIALDWAPKIFQ